MADHQTDSEPGFAMKMAIQGIRARFAGVRDVTTGTLSRWFSERSSDSQNLVLLDCRDPAEYEISHIDGAQRVDWQKVEPQEFLSTLPTDKPSTVVLYCSVGYRSSALAQKMQQFLSQSEESSNSKVQVFNLEGSIFKWANEGRPMVNLAGQSTPLCHPYNAVYGMLLNSQLRSKVPPSN